MAYFTIALLDAAHQYGLDNLVIGGSNNATLRNSLNAGGLGTLTSTINSWGDGMPPLNMPVHTTELTSRGYTVQVDWQDFFVGSDIGTVTSLTIVKDGQVIATGTGSTPVYYKSEAVAGVLGYGSKVIGNQFDNVLYGYSFGTDFGIDIDGGGGLDTVVFDAPYYMNVITRIDDAVRLSVYSGVYLTLVNVERLKFDTLSVAFDTEGSAGQAYRLYQAAFNRAPDWSGLGYQMNALDHGWSLHSIAQNFLDSPEFSRTYGHLDNQAYVTALYANVLHRAPDVEGLAYQINALQTIDRAQLLANFSESPENQAALIGTIQNGMTYYPQV
jgi:hypothetical protein